MNTKVFVRDTQQMKDVAITDRQKPIVDEIMVGKWQSIIDIVAEILEVPAGLIMRITQESMKVFVKSSAPENPYEVGGEDTLGKGLYCETVIGTNNELHVPNASASDLWKDNPDVELDMISYYGLPIHWPDQSFFGTICVLDNKENHFSDRFKRLMRSFQRAIEDDLKLLTNQQQLDFLANKDHLTGCYNHMASLRALSDEIDRSKRSKAYFSLIVMDIDDFRFVNEQVGYAAGDDILKNMTDILLSETRAIDTVGRISGDEFMIICPTTNEAGVKKVIEKLKNRIEAHAFSGEMNLTCSFGYAVYTGVKDTTEFMMTKANKKLDKDKEKNASYTGQ